MKVLTDLMNKMQAESKKKAIETDCYGFAHAEFMGRKVKAYSFVVNVNSKHGVCQTVWYLDDKKVSRAKFIASFE